MQKPSQSIVQKWIQKSLWLSALLALITSPLAYGAGDFLNTTPAQLKRISSLKQSTSPRMFATEFVTSVIPSGLMDFLQPIGIDSPNFEIAETRTLQFWAFAPIQLNSNSLQSSTVWESKNISQLFKQSSIFVKQNYYNGIDGRISTPTNLKIVGPSSLDCDLSLRMINDPEAMSHLAQVEDVSHLIAAKGVPTQVFFVETKNCNIIFKWTYQVALIYPTDLNQSQLFVVGRMFVKNESLQKLKLAALFSSPKKIFDQRLTLELKSFANALETTFAEPQP